MRTKPCPSCGTDLFEEDDFCPKCGAVLDESLLAEDPLFAPKTEPSLELPLPPVSTEEPSFDGVLEELTGSFQVLEAAHVLFSAVESGSRIDPDALTRVSAVLGVRAGSDPSVANLSPYEKIVLSLINGNRSVARVAKKSGLGADDVRRAIGVLGERGLIELKGELTPNLHGLLHGDLDDSGEFAMPTEELASPARTMPAVALLDPFSEELTAEIAPDEMAPPPVDEPAPVVLASDAPQTTPRSAPRFHGDRSVVVQAGREELGALWVSNLSKGGLFVETDAPPPAYTAVEITLESPDGSLVLKGEVVHVQLPGGAGPAGAGIQLATPPPDVRERLENYLRGLAPLSTAATSSEATEHAERLEAALAAARNLSNLGADDPATAIGVPLGSTQDVVEARVRELTALFSGPHPTATPPQAARCENAIKLLGSVVARIPVILPSSLPPPSPESPSSGATAAQGASAAFVNDFSSTSARSSEVAAYVPMPGMPQAPPRAPAPRPARAAAPSPAAAPAPPAPAPAPVPGDNTRRLKAQQLLDTALKELRAGKRSSALTYIRMAAEVAPDDPQVKALLATWTGR